jgi:hypothetical protein
MMMPVHVSAPTENGNKQNEQREQHHDFHPSVSRFGRLHMFKLEV